MLFETTGLINDVVKGEEAVNSEAILELVNTGMVWVNILMVDETRGVKYSVSDENLPVLVDEILVAKLIGQDGDTETLLNAVGRGFSLDGRNLVDADDLGVDGLPGIDIEGVFVGSESDVVLDEVKVNLKVSFVGVWFV